MSGWLTGFGLIGVVLVLTGCGASEPVTIETGALGKALVTAEELSPRAEPTDDSPEPCNPIPIFEERATEAAVSKTFGIGETRLKEAVGYFSGDERSAAAFAKLASEERSECIRESIEEFSEGREIGVEKLEPLGLSDSESLARYAATNSSENGEKAVDVATIKFELCVAAIIIFQEDGSAEAARHLFEIAAQPAADTCQ